MNHPSRIFPTECTQWTISAKSFLLNVHNEPPQQNLLNRNEHNKPLSRIFYIGMCTMRHTSRLFCIIMNLMRHTSRILYHYELNEAHQQNLLYQNEHIEPHHQFCWGGSFMYILGNYDISTLTLFLLFLYDSNRTY